MLMTFTCDKVLFPEEWNKMEAVERGGTVSGHNVVGSRAKLLGWEIGLCY